jgi:hypothetical protein
MMDVSAEEKDLERSVVYSKASVVREDKLKQSSVNDEDSVPVNE